MRSILFLLLLTAMAFAVGPVEEKLAGLKVGADQDGQVVRLFGPGHLIAKPWGGDRYYRNGDLYLFAAYATDRVLSEEARLVRFGVERLVIILGEAAACVSEECRLEHRSIP